MKKEETIKNLYEMAEEELVEVQMTEIQQAKQNNERYDGTLSEARWILFFRARNQEGVSYEEMLKTYEAQDNDEEYHQMAIRTLKNLINISKKINLKEAYKKLTEGLAEGKKYEEIDLGFKWEELNKGQEAAWHIYRNQMKWANDKNFARYTNVENIEDVLIIDDIVWEKEYEGLIQTCKDNNITKIYFLDKSTAAQRALCEFINAGAKITKTEMVDIGEFIREKEYAPALIIEL